MERTHFVVIAVVVAALALFGLRFFSSSSDDVELAALGGSGRLGSDADRDGGGRPGDRRRLGALGGSGASGTDGGRLGGGERGAGGTGRSGSAEFASGGGSRLGGSLGQSGSARIDGAGGGASGGGAEVAGQIGPRAARKADLVDSLGARPPTQSDLDQPVKAENGDDIALKIEKPEDISEQAGREHDVDKPADTEDGLEIGADGRIEFPDGGGVNGESGEISFRIKPNWAGSDQTDNALVQLRQEHEWNNRLELVKNGEFLRFILTDNTGKEVDISSRITNWQALEEHEITARWNNGVTELLIDGQVAGRGQYPGQFEPPPQAPLYVGADWRGSNYGGLDGKVYGFQVTKNATF
jgi:hypothetical protein